MDDMNVQQITPREQQPKRKYAFLLHSIAFIIGCILIIVGGTVWILSVEKVISGVWSIILPIVFVVLGVIVGLGQFLCASYKR